MVSAKAHIATVMEMLYTSGVEYPFPPVGIVGAADGKNRRAFFFLILCDLCASVFSMLNTAHDYC